MKCTTIRINQECSFMAKHGCSYTNGHCEPVVESCTGCDRLIKVETGTYCTATPNPKNKWKFGICNLSTHIIKIIKEDQKKINPIKASKRGENK